jgi:hypothetical protein
MDALLRQQIQMELAAIGSSASILHSSARPDKLYEIFILSCVIRALKDIGATLDARDSKDQPTTNLVFRLGPGLIYNPASAPGFILVHYEGKEYEVQNSLRVGGTSRVLHELDVCILDRAHALECRQHEVDPNSQGVKFLAECKFYGATLDLNLGREYLGLVSEFKIRVKTIASNIHSDDIHTLVRRHSGTTNFAVSPAQPGKIKNFIGWLAKELEHVL